MNFPYNMFFPYNTKAKNPAEFITILQDQLTKYYGDNLPNLEVPQVNTTEGTKYIRIALHERGGYFVWGFIVKKDMMTRRGNLKAGDLLKPAGKNAPAPIARGNIYDGTAKYGPYGAAYLK